MSTQTKYFCDIYGCKNECHKDRVEMQVIFTTEQTEGRSSDRYFTKENIHICNDHKIQLLKEGKYILADGAQGYNNYRL